MSTDVTLSDSACIFFQSGISPAWQCVNSVAADCFIGIFIDSTDTGFRSKHPFIELILLCMEICLNVLVGLYENNSHKRGILYE